MAFTRRRRVRKPADRRSLTAAVISAGGIIVFVLLIVRSFRLRGETGSLAAGLGVLFLMISVISLIGGIRQRKKDSYSGLSRGLGVILPLASTILWGLLYLLGFLLSY